MMVPIPVVVVRVSIVPVVTIMFVVCSTAMFVHPNDAT
jgi:hypothetical protein